jgi:hypothetical protein
MKRNLVILTIVIFVLGIVFFIPLPDEWQRAFSEDNCNATGGKWDSNYGRCRK